MATGTLQPPEQTVDGIAPSNIYEKCVVRNRRICNSCFRRMRAVLPEPPDEYWDDHAVRTGNNASTATLRVITTDITVGTGPDGEGASVGPSYTDSGEVAFKPRGQIVCRSCGFIDGERRAARSLGEFMDAAKRLVERVGEQDIPVDRDALLDRAREQKTTTGYENKDFACFEMAVEAGVEAAVADD